MAEFRNYVCWNTQGVNRVINIDADYMPDAVFWAVHVDVPLIVLSPDEYADQTRQRGIGNVKSANEVLANFLASDRKHYQLAVLGPTGSGKSHLIHWMRQRLETDEHKVVVTVRRTETNLRAILEKLISELPPEKRQSFREDLERAGTTLHNRDGQKQTLINNLAVAIGQDVVRPDSNLDGEIEDVLIKSLPAMLLDPNLRKDKFLKDDEIIDQLVGRSFSGGTGRRDAERLVFAPEHLPLRDVDHKRASGLAQDALQYLLMDQDRTVSAALQIINRNLDSAIALSMNFSGDQLAQLMGELRASLKGRELILLFEEFARFQGYDTALLDALLVQGDDRLCNIRWAIACTSGFYSTIKDTARSRMTAIVDMGRADDSANESSKAKRFTGRYLNAVRCGLETLQNAYEKDRRSDPPNKCESCPHTVRCHQAFGASEHEFGLYPLNSRAIEFAADHSKSQESGLFNPREFQREILTPLLTEGGRSLAAGTFPDRVLFDKLGGASNLELAERSELQQRYPDYAQRYMALHALWRGREKSPPLSNEIYRAFDLPVPQDSVKPAGDIKPVVEKPSTEINKNRGTKPPSTPAQSPTPGVQTSPELREIEQWPGGGILSQGTAQKLREGLYRLINRAIDWDSAGLATSFFSNATGSSPFGNRSIQFANQDTSGGMPTAITIKLPLVPNDESDFLQTAFALSALLEYDRNDDWGENADRKLTALLNLVERCANEVVRQIKLLEGNRTEWDPIAGALELLAIAAALSGRIDDAGANETTLLDACFREPQTVLALSRGSARNLLELIIKYQKQLIDIVRAHCTGTKGGAVGQFLDPSRLLTTLRNFLESGWKMTRTPIQLEARQYKEVGDLYSRIARDLPDALKNERSARLAWLANVESSFGKVDDANSFSASVSSLSTAVLGAGINIANLIKLKSLADQFMKEGFRRELEAVRELQSAKISSTAPFCGRGDSAAAESTDNFISEWRKTCKSIEHELNARNPAISGDVIQSVVSDIDASLEKITRNLHKLEEYANAP